jgi:hypothetical protein
MPDALDLALMPQQPAPTARPDTSGGGVSTPALPQPAAQPAGDAVDFALHPAQAAPAPMPTQNDRLGFPMDEAYKGDQNQWVETQMANGLAQHLLSNDSFRHAAQAHINEWHPTQAGMSLSGLLSADKHAQVDTPLTPDLTYEYLKGRADPNALELHREEYRQRYPVARYLMERDKAADMAAEGFLNSPAGQAVTGTPDEHRATRAFVSQTLAANGWNIDRSAGLPPFQIARHADQQIHDEQTGWFQKYLSEPTYAAASGVVKGTAKIGFGLGQLGSGVMGDAQGVQQYSDARQGMENFMPQSQMSKDHPYSLGLAETAGGLVPQVVAGWVTGPALPLIMNGVTMGGDTQDATYKMALAQGYSPQAASRLSTSSGLIVGGVTSVIDRFGPLQRVLRSNPEASGALKRWAVGTVTGAETGAAMQAVQEAAPYLQGLKEADRNSLMESLNNVKVAAFQGGALGGPLEAMLHKPGSKPSDSPVDAGEPPKVTLPDTLKPQDTPADAAPPVPQVTQVTPTPDTATAGPKLPDEAQAWGKDRLNQWAKDNGITVDAGGDRLKILQRIKDATDAAKTEAQPPPATPPTPPNPAPQKVEIKRLDQPPTAPPEAPKPDGSTPPDKVAPETPQAPETPSKAEVKPAETPAPDNDPLGSLSDNFGAHPDESKWLVDAMQKFPSKEGGIDGVKLAQAIKDKKFPAPPKIDHPTPAAPEVKPDENTKPEPPKDIPPVDQKDGQAEQPGLGGDQPGETPAKPEAKPGIKLSDKAQAAIEDLRKSGIPDAEAVKPKNQVQHAIADFAEATGKEAVVIKSKTKFKGVNHGDHPDVIFVHEDVNNPRHVRESLAHEFFDQMDAETRQKIRDVVPPHELKIAEKEYMDRMERSPLTKERAAKMTPQERGDEALSLILGKDMSAGHNWRRLVERNPEGFQHLTDAFGRVADRLAGKHERIDKAMDALHKGIESAKPGPVKGRVSTMDMKDLHVDPDRFQYKGGGDEGGVVNKMEGVKYDPERAGVVAVWKDSADGKTYVINGHHRYDLAKRSGESTVNVLHLEAKDAAEARLKGALINIGEGRGTSTDAAKLFRDAGIKTPEQLREIGVALSESKGREGLALAGLSDKLFRMVAKQELPESRGVAIGEAAKTHAAQDALFDLLKGKGESLTNDQIRELGRMADTAPVTKEDVGGLFGSDWVTKNHLLEKAKLSDYVKRSITQDEKAFGSAARNADRLKKVGDLDAKAAKAESKQAAEAGYVYNKLSTMKGPVADALNDGAARMAGGEKFEKVRDDVYGKVLDALKNDPALRYLPGGSVAAKLKAALEKHVYGDKTLIGEDVLPKVANMGRGLLQIRKWFKRTFGPQTFSPEAQQAGQIFRENMARADLLQEQAKHAFQAARDWFEKQTDAFNNAYAAKVDEGTAQPNKGMQDIADTMKGLNESQRVELFKLGMDAVKTWSEDYFGHIWKEKSKAKTVFAKLFGQTGALEGSKSFLRERFYKLYQDGLDAGLTPLYPNPVDAFLHKYAEINQFIFARKSMEALKSLGMLDRVDARGPHAEIPDGWMKVNDRAFTIFGPPLEIKKPGGLQVDEGGIHTKGYVIAPEGVAHLINNVVTPSYFKGSAVFEMLNGINQSMTQAALGFSGFHLFKVAKESINMRVAQAIDSLAHGDVGDMAAHVAKAASTPAEAFAVGTKLQKAMLDPKLATPEQAKVIEFLLKGGARAKADKVYETTIAQNMMRAFKDGGLNGLIRGGWRIGPAIGEKMTKFVMSDVVQKQKLGVSYLHAVDAMERLKGASPEKVKAEAMRVVDHVDNVLGLMIRDNLFWNKTARDIGTLSMLSVGWNLGAKRALVGGLSDIGKSIKGIATGKGAGDTRRIAYLFSTALLQAGGGALATYLMTGKGPEKMIDYIYPRTGKKDQQGHDIRINLGLYTKDYYDFLSHPFQTLADKSSPILHTAYSLCDK